MTSHAFPAYHTRSVEALGTTRVGAWTLKVYTIDAHGDVRPASLIDPALTAVPSLLPASVPGGEAADTPVPDAPEGAAGARVHPEGFVIVHAGADAHWLLVFWWTDACLLHRRMAAAPLEGPTVFDGGVPDTLVACSWELAIVQHERDAWVRHVQGRGPEADVAAYHADVLVDPEV